MREVDRLAASSDWDGLLALRAACLDATEETGRQLWGPARYAAYRVALDGPAALAAAMVEPGVVRFGLGPLTEVVAQRHTFAELAPHLDATVLPVVAQERVLRGEDLRGDDRAAGAPDDPPLVLQPFEPAYVLPGYRPTERLDGAVADASEQARDGWGPLGDDPRDVAAQDVGRADGRPRQVAALVAALEDAVAPWSAQSGGEVRIVALRGTVDDACRAVLAGTAGRDGGGGGGEVRRGPVSVAELLGMLAHAGASGGVHGRRRGGAAGRSLAWWVARCATGLDRSDTFDPEELEFRLEDVARVAFRSPGEATWRLELALGIPGGARTAPQSAAPGTAQPGAGEEWAVAIAAFDRSEDSEDSEDDGDRSQPGDASAPGSVSGSAPDGAPW